MVHSHDFQTCKLTICQAFVQMLCQPGWLITATHVAIKQENFLLLGYMHTLINMYMLYQYSLKLNICVCTLHKCTRIAITLQFKVLLSSMIINILYVCVCMYISKCRWIYKLL